MPIKGLSDRGLSFPEIGNIRKGIKAKNASGVEYPKEVPYFVVQFDEQEEKRAALFSSKYGSQPTEINILLPFNEIERCWDCWYEAYVAGRMIARSDGEIFLYLADYKTGRLIVQNSEPRTPHKEVVAEYTNSRGKTELVKMRTVGRLKIVIPELQSLAYLTVHTGSFHDIRNISEQLEGIKALNGGRLAGIPLVLRRRPKKISIPNEDGTRKRMTKWMLSIEADPNWVKKMLTQMKHLALPGNGLALLPEPENQQDAEESENIEEYDDPEEVEEMAEPEGSTDGEFVPAEPAPKTVKELWPTEAKVTYETAATFQSRSGKKMVDLPLDEIRKIIDTREDARAKAPLSDNAQMQLDACYILVGLLS
ncbi:hypothetical protein CCP3SC15_2440003 [Gammaproteobacteria bacterium]